MGTCLRVHAWRVREVSVQVGTRLLGDVDVEAKAQALGTKHVLKGMFFSSLLQGLPPAEWEALAPQLVNPPRDGRYVAFRDYLQSDYLRVAVAVAQRRFPGVGTREGLRQLSRQDFDVFAASRFGKVLLSLVRDARGALLKFPTVYDKVAGGDYRMTGRELDDQTVRIQFERYPHTWPFQVGQLEATVLHFGAEPEILVREVSPEHVELDVHHGG